MLKLLPILLLLIFQFSVNVPSQVPPIGPGVSHDLAKWRAARYSDVRYKLNLTLEKMSPVLRGTMEIRVNVSVLPRGVNFGSSGLRVNSPGTPSPTPSTLPDNGISPIILDWRAIAGHEKDSTISNVYLNGQLMPRDFQTVEWNGPVFTVENEHIVFREGVKAGENVIKLDFTSPILTSGAGVTRYVDKEDGAEYIYSLFVPSDASTAFPVFDQPDLKARFSLNITAPKEWNVVSNGYVEREKKDCFQDIPSDTKRDCGPTQELGFAETKPISTYVFAFAAGPFEAFADKGGNLSGSEGALRRTDTTQGTLPTGRVSALEASPVSNIYIRKSQAAKFKPHAAEVFRLNREGIKFLEQYFDYKFPFPKYDIVLIPEFPFGGMEHAGATFLRESSVIFPQEPTKNDYISRANVIFHEAAHQWFGDTVTMKWFDDLWLKEGFAEFMAYKTLEKVQGGNPTGREGAPRAQNAGQMPEVNAWKVFYERNKRTAYLTDSTKGTTPIYQEIANLNSAKSAYGNIVYRKAPSFLKQAEFYIGADKFQTAVRAFLKKHEFANAGWEDLVKEFETASKMDMKEWAEIWVKQRGLDIYKTEFSSENVTGPLLTLSISNRFDRKSAVPQKLNLMWSDRNGGFEPNPIKVSAGTSAFKFGIVYPSKTDDFAYFFPNYQDYGYGIFLLDDKSRDYVLKNIQNEKDDFLRTMMWGSLWDSVREGELDPKVYVELAIKNLESEQDETIVSSILSRTATALAYYMSEPPAVAGGLSRSTTNADETRIALVKVNSTDSNVQPPATAGGSDLRTRFENVLIDRIKNAPTLGQRITYYRSLLNVARSETALRELRKLLFNQSSIRPPIGIHRSGIEMIVSPSERVPRKIKFGTPETPFELKAKDKFEIISLMISSGYAHGEQLLADLEKLETDDDAKRYAYAARAAIPTKENKAKYWNDFVNNDDISESWIEAAISPWNNVRHSDLSLPFLQRALTELPNIKRERKIFFLNNWLAAFIGGQRSEEALAIVNKFLKDNPDLDNDLRLKILENSDIIERAVKIRRKYP